MNSKHMLEEAIALRESNPGKAKEIFNTIVRTHAESHEAEVAGMHLEFLIREEREAGAHEQSRQLEIQDEEARIAQKQKNKIVALRRAAFWSVATPVAAMAFGLLLTGIIPGCSVDAGRGAAGCEFFGVDFGGLIVFLASVGFFFTVFGCLILAPLLFILSLFTPPSRELTKLRKKQSSKNH